MGKDLGHALLDIMGVLHTFFQSAIIVTHSQTRLPYDATRV